MEDNHVLADRRAKFDDYAAKADVAYPNTLRPTHLTAQIKQAWDKPENDAEALEKVNEIFAIAGRVMFLRMFGKFAFVKIQDRAGQLQASVAIDALGEDAFADFKNFVESGDLIYVSGGLTRTKTGELTLKAAEVAIVNKTLRPLPDKFHGLADVETRHRMRYVDLMMNEEVRETFKKRAAMMHHVRNFFADNDFMEVETPMLHVQHGGAAAKPFITHHNALDMELALRIAPELHLKRLVVGGFERVFEINRNFRNEGISVRHNPEFTMLEAYGSHMDYIEMMDFVEAMVKDVAEKVTGSLNLPYGEHTIDMSGTWKRLTMQGAVMELGGATEADLQSLEAMQKFAESKGLKIEPRKLKNKGLLLNELFEELCEDKLINPTFITDYPIEVSPFARSHDGNPDVTQRAELFVAGRELGNLFSELNDPIEQARRFDEQLKQKEQGDDEAMPYDHDYVRALEYGMMPAAGVGVGLDRLAMLLTNQSTIREVILFPTLRPEGGSVQDEAEDIPLAGEEEQAS